MHSAISPEALRRSSRVPFTLPLLVTSMAPNIQFSEVCETMIVNAHGCAVRSPAQLETGTPVYFHNMEGRQTTAHVVDCHPLGTDHKQWLVGARLDQPDNFWGVTPCPKDWSGVAYVPVLDDANAVQKPARVLKPGHKSETESALKVVHKNNISEQLSEERLRNLIAEIVQPLHGELTSLRERLARPESKRSQFEVSLSYIPPEVEEKLWERLRQDLGERALQHATEQTQQVLETATATIEQKIASSEKEFRQQLTQELHSVETSARRLSDEIGDGLRQQHHNGLEKLQQHAAQAGTHLSMRSEELFKSLQKRMTEENAARLQEIEQVRAAIESESSRQQALVSDLAERAAKLDVFVRRMESDADQRLTQMLSDVLSRARTQLESSVSTILEEMEARNAKELDGQLEAACGRLKLVQQALETSVTESFKEYGEQTVRSFEQAMDELAGHAVSRWRRSLARDLGSVARILGDEVRLEVVSDRSNNA